MNRPFCKRRYPCTFILGVFLCLDLVFFVAAAFAQSQIFVLPGERIVRIDKGIPQMHRKIMDYQCPQTGYYRIYSRVWYNSGDVQLNESFYMDWRTNMGSAVTPIDTNVAGPYRVIKDDPGPPHHAWRECGTFYLTAGRYSLWMHHYSLISDSFPEFLNSALNPIIPESVRLTDSLKIVYYPGTDGAVRITPITMGAKPYQGQMAPVIMNGESFQYRLAVYNRGEEILGAPLLRNTLPDGILAESFSTTPTHIQSHQQEWLLPDLAAGDSLEIFVTARATQEFPVGFTALLDHAELEVVNDPDSTNNHDQAVVYGYKATPTAADLQINLTAKSDTLVEKNSVLSPAVRPGGKIAYTLEIQNFGPDEASEIVVRQILPPFFTVQGSDPVHSPFGTGSVIWHFDHLAAGQSLTISLWGEVSFALPAQDSLLVSYSEVSATTQDPLLSNNKDQALVYALQAEQEPPIPASKNFDLALDYRAVTDTTIMVNGQSQQAVLAGQTYSYQITLTNNGPGTARDILLWALVPDSVSISSPTPFVQKSDTLFWNLDSLAAAGSTQITFNASVVKLLPQDPFELFSAGRVAADNDTTSGNNDGQALVYALQAEQEPPIPDVPLPYITAQPALVQVNDSVTVEVKVEGAIVTWDIWVYYVNGRIDSSFADDYILDHPLISGVWHQDLPLFGDTRLLTSALEEPVIFELRVRDAYGRMATAQSMIKIFSMNRMKLDRNVYEPDRQEPLAIQFKLSSNRVARLDVYDIAGTHIAKLSETDYLAGWNTYYWDGRTSGGMLAGSGVYIITIHSGDFKDWKKCMIVR